MRKKMSGPSVELSFYCLIINNLTPSPFFEYFYYPRKLRVSTLIGREDPVSLTFSLCVYCLCLLSIDKARAKDETYNLLLAVFGRLVSIFFFN